MRSADRRDQRLPGVERRGLELVELADAVDDVGRRMHRVRPDGRPAASVSPDCTWTTASVSGTGVDELAVPTTPPNWATTPSHTVITAASRASPTVVAGVMGRRRWEARDITTPGPRYRIGAPPGRRRL